MSKLFTLFFFVGLFLSASAAKENNINGSVIADGKPISGAVVYLLKDTGTVIVKTTITDTDGKFSFTSTLANFRITVNAMGYNEFTSSIKQPGLPIEAVLTASEKLMTAVTVVAQRKLVEVKTDKTVINVDAAPTNIGTTALEVLEKAPGVMVDKDGNISMLGKAGVVIMIDGKPTYMSNADVANYLKSLSSSQLDQIELITQPSAKFDAAGNAGIINIKTKTNKPMGTNGSIGATYSQGVNRRLSLNGSLGYRKGKFNIFGSVNYFDNISFNEVYLSRNIRNPNTKEILSVLDQTTGMSVHVKPFNTKFSLDYLATKNTSFGMAFSGNFNNNFFKLPTRMEVINSAGVLQGVYNSATENAMNINNIIGNIYWKTKLDTTGRELTADIDFIRNSSDFNQTMNSYYYPQQNNPAESPYILKGLNPSVVKVYTGKIDYVHPLKKNAKLEAGIKASFVETDNNSLFNVLKNNVWEVDPRSNEFIYKENIYAAYLNGNKQWKKWGLQLGLRLENTIMNGNQITTQQKFERNLLQLFPTAFLSYKASDISMFTINFGRRIDRPNYRDLNPFQLLLNPFTYNQGNPNLRPQFTNNAELGYSFKNGMITAKLGYSKTTDIITDIIRANDAEKVTYQTRENVASRENINLSLGFNKSLNKILTAGFFANIYNNKYNGIFNNEPLDEQFTSFSLNMNNQFKFGKGWSAELSGFYNHKNLLLAQAFIEPMWQVGFGVSKQVFKNKGTIRLSARDIFFSQRVKIDQRYQNLDSKFQQYSDSRHVALSFTFRFAKNASNVIRRNGGSSQEEQNRVGGGNN
ncbi:TonB-dependent receptor domain-containing protein [Sediminibacterium sp.]|uniref:TonB-dependent receptor domain-containing protein n=1 Tax=Sediminibacterium sp. TaxID=1917865 RepID=UPI002736716B|nr:TonB-dependent receptor [Sediminibacterium sp.]MDP3394502.1 TonB-dependent receptor [Sediminibacterium sp.]MDP3568337.1 TonB-dependent receptor [Sediminibacterium sp.]